MLGVLLSVLGILWTIDLLQTLKVTGKYGPRAEYNPFARFLLKHGKQDFIAFKAVDFVIVSAILIFIYKSYVGIAYTLLVSFILIYVYTLLHNYAVISDLRTKKTDL